MLADALLLADVYDVTVSLHFQPRTFSSLSRCSSCQAMQKHVGLSLDALST